MSIRFKLFLVLWFLLIVLTSNAYSGIIWGTGVLIYGFWDFSEEESVLGYGDIFIADVVDPPLGCRVCATCYPTLIAEIDSTFEELKFAPEDTTVYDIDAPASLDRTYVVRTWERHYVKFRFLELSYQRSVIEYVYQPDGSRRLFGDISVEKSPWGAIKSIFRSTTSSK